MSRRMSMVLGGVLVVATLLLYLPVAHHDFLNVWDDDVYITHNQHVRSGLRLTNLTWAFTTLKPFYWQPVTWLSHMIDCQWFGLNSGAHHYVNVLLHAANAWLLFFLLFSATRALWRSFLVAALFVLHPTNVETVAWTAERNTLIFTFFTLTTIAAYGWYVRRQKSTRYLLVLGSFLLAAMSKPTVVTVPIILLLVDYWPLRRNAEQPLVARWSGLLLEKMPLILLGAGISVLAMRGEDASGTLMPLSVLPMSTRLENAAISCVAYIGKMLWPTGLSPYYPHPIIAQGPHLPPGDVVASVLVLAAIPLFAIYPRCKKYALMGWLLFLTTLGPVIGIVQTGSQARQDHFTYFSCIGVFIFLVWMLADALEMMGLNPVLPALASICLLSTYAVITVHYLRFWQNGVALFAEARAVAGAPNPMLEQLYGTALFDAGRVDEALQHYEESCALGPGNEHCHYFIAEILFDRRQFPGAIEEYQRTLMLTGNRERALSCLTKSSEALVEMGNTAGAEVALTNALKIDPSNTTARGLLERLGRTKRD